MKIFTRMSLAGLVSVIHAVIVQQETKLTRTTQLLNYSCNYNTLAILELIRHWKWTDFILLSDKKEIATCALKIIQLKASFIIFPTQMNTSDLLRSLRKGHETKRIVVWVKPSHWESILQSAFTWGLFRKRYTWLFICEKIMLKPNKMFRNYLREDSMVFISEPGNREFSDPFKVYRVQFYAYPTLHVTTEIIASCNRGTIVQMRSSFSSLDLKDYVMKIGFIQYPPFSYWSSTQSNHAKIVTGFYPELIKLFSALLGFKYVYIHESTNRFGLVDENGTWAGLIGFLQRKEVDMTLSSAIAPLRLPVADFLPTMIELTNKLVLHQASEEHSIDFSQYVRPFSMDIWLSTLFVWISATVCLTLVWCSSPIHAENSPAFLSRKHYLQKQQNAAGTVHKQAVYFLFIFWIVILKQDLPKSVIQKNISLYLVIAAFALFAVVLTNSYTCTLTASLSISRGKAPFDDLSAVLDSKEYDVGLLDGSLVHQAVLDAKTGIMKKLRNNVQGKLYNIVNTTAIGVRKVCSETFAFIDNTQAIAAQEETCSLQLIGRSLLSFFNTIAFPEDSPFVEVFRLQLMKIRSSGIWNRLMNRCMKTLESQSHVIKPTLRRSTYGLQQFSGAFLILAIGIMISIVTLCVEKAVYFSSA